MSAMENLVMDSRDFVGLKEFTESRANFPFSPRNPTHKSFKNQNFPAFTESRARFFSETAPMHSVVYCVVMVCYDVLWCVAL